MSIDKPEHPASKYFMANSIYRCVLEHHSPTAVQRYSAMLRGNVISRHHGMVDLQVLSAGTPRLPRLQPAITSSVSSPFAWGADVSTLVMKFAKLARG